MYYRVESFLLSLSVASKSKGRLLFRNPASLKFGTPANFPVWVKPTLGKAALFFTTKFDFDSSGK